MAITKILNIQESEGRNPTTHLKNALKDKGIIERKGPDNGGEWIIR